MLPESVTARDLMQEQKQAAGDPLWDDDAFRRRVSQLARDRGLSIPEVCRRAGVSASYLAHPAGRQGRSIEALLKIARELGVGLIELIGSMPDHHDASPTDENLARVALVAELAALLYIALGARRQVPSNINPVTVTSAILRLIEAEAQQQQR